MRISIMLVLLLSFNQLIAQVYPNITISSDKSQITIGETINFKAVFTGGGATPKIEWKKNGIVVGTNSENFSDNTLKDGDKIACVLTSNDPQRVMNIVASNFISPKVNPVQIMPSLVNGGSSGNTLNLNSNTTEKVIWKKDGAQIPNPIMGNLGNGISIAGGENSNIDLKSPGGIFFDSFSKTLYVVDQNRVLKYTENSLVGNIIIDQLNFANDIWVDKDSKIYILSSSDIKIFDPGSSISNTTIPIQGSSPNRLFIAENGGIYISCGYNNSIEKYNPISKLFSTVAGLKNVSGTTNSLLNNPAGIFVNSKNEIFIADQLNHRIIKWTEGSSSGIVVAGGNGQSTYNNNVFDNKLSYPTDVSVDDNGNIYVSEYNGARITKWEPNQNSSLVIGGNGQGTSLNRMSSQLYGFKIINDIFYLNDRGNKRILKWKKGEAQATLIAGNHESNSFLFTPNDLKINNENLYISDRFYYRIQKWDLKKKRGELYFNFNTNPNYIEFDKDNNLFISDDNNNMIKKYNNIFLSTYAGKLTKGNALNLFNKPQGLKFDKENNLFIVDSGNNRITKWPLNATEGILVAGNGNNGNSNFELNNPTDIEIDKNGAFYVLDSGNNRIQKFTSNNLEGITIFGQNIPSGNNIQLNKPTGLYLNSNNELIITDKNNHRIIKFNLNNSSIRIIAGNNGNGGNTNQLSFPNKSIEDNEGNLLVADSNNNRIQKFTLENSQSYTPSSPGNYTATVTTQFGEFTTPVFRILAQDADKDGVEDALDKCPNTPIGEQVNNLGCSLSQIDTDNDGVNDKNDKCPLTISGNKVDLSGCADNQKDSDGDGITDNLDRCKNTPLGIKVDLSGCSEVQKDSCSNKEKPILLITNGNILSTNAIANRYNWYQNEQLIQNATTSTLTVTNSGRYAVQTVLSNNCTSPISEQILIQITGTNEENPEIIIYPNPFENSIRIKYPPTLGNGIKILIYDSKGSLVYSKEKASSMDVQNLSKLTTGSYILNIESNKDGNLKAFKIIKMPLANP